MLYVLIYQLLLCLCQVAHGTKIKWTWGDNDSGSDAARAPRSQRYWDTHGIQRPDYAKTDDEVAAERGDNTPSSLGATMQCLLLFALALIGVTFFYFRNAQGGGGARLGSTGGWSKFPLHLGGSEEDVREKARKARLERFGASPEKHE